MANTYVAIQTVTVGSGGATEFDFTSIPSTFTDLVVKVSSRTNRSDTRESISIKFNNDTSSIYSYRIIYGDGSAAASSSGSAGTFLWSGESTGSTATASVFGSTEIYIPNYAGSNNKSLSADFTSENNATAIIQGLSAGLYSSATAISRITLTGGSGFTFQKHSTSTLYGIKSS
jgi:hypothetical protein